jgi:hypothetical protein
MSSTGIPMTTNVVPTVPFSRDASEGLGDLPLEPDIAERPTVRRGPTIEVIRQQPIRRPRRAIGSPRAGRVPHPARGGENIALRPRIS